MRVLRVANHEESFNDDDLFEEKTEPSSRNYQELAWLTHLKIFFLNQIASSDSSCAFTHEEKNISKSSFFSLKR